VLRDRAGEPTVSAPSGDRDRVAVEPQDLGLLEHRAQRAGADDVGDIDDRAAHGGDRDAATDRPLDLAPPVHDHALDALDAAWCTDLAVAEPRRPEAPVRRRGSMAQRGARAARQYGPQPPALRGERRVAYGVNARMYGVQDGAETVIDRRLAHPRREQLPARDHAVPARTEHRDDAIGRPWAFSTCHDAGDRAHAGKLAP
jgi:hypothetical protein